MAREGEKQISSLAYAYRLDGRLGKSNRSNGQEGQFWTQVSANFFGNRFPAVRLDLALPSVEVPSGHTIKRT
jgi:hypothetical protein